MTDYDFHKVGADKLGADGDVFYERLMAAHDDLNERQSHALNARLVLLMGNQIGDLKILDTILQKAGAYHD